MRDDTKHTYKIEHINKVNKNLDFIIKCIQDETWLTWREICDGLEWEYVDRGSSRDADNDIFEAYFKFETKGERRWKKYKITGINETPNIKAGRSSIYELIDDLVLLSLYQETEVFTNKTMFLTWIDICKKVGIGNRYYKYIRYGKDGLAKQLGLNIDVFDYIITKQADNNRKLIRRSLERLAKAGYIQLDIVMGVILEDDEDKEIVEADDIQEEYILAAEFLLLETGDAKMQGIKRRELIKANKYDKFQSNVLKMVNERQRENDEETIEKYYLNVFKVKVIDRHRENEIEDFEQIMQDFNNIIIANRKLTYVAKAKQPTNQKSKNELPFNLEDCDFESQVDIILDAFFNLNTKIKIDTHILYRRK